MPTKHQCRCTMRSTSIGRPMAMSTARRRAATRPTVLTLLLVCGISAPLSASAASSVEKLQEFGLDQVQITDTYQQNLFTKDITYLITTLDSNRLMAGFKAVSSGNEPDQPLRRLGELKTYAAIRWATGCPRWRTPTSKPWAQRRNFGRSDQDQARRRDFEAQVVSAIQWISVRNAHVPVRRLR